MFHSTCVPTNGGPNSAYAVSLRVTCGVRSCVMGYDVPFSRSVRIHSKLKMMVAENVPRKSLFEFKWRFHSPKCPNLAAGIKTHALQAKPKNMTTWVHHGVRKRLYLAVMFDQSRDKLRKPIPPKPAPMKFATWLCGATQQRKASEPSIGNTYSGSTLR